jgi:hypothetical protein
MSPLNPPTYASMQPHPCRHLFIREFAPPEKAETAVAAMRTTLDWHLLFWVAAGLADLPTAACLMTNLAAVAVGARFVAHNRGGRGPAWRNTPTVTAADPRREFAFNRSGPGIGSYTWRYVMELAGTGTLLTESYQVGRHLWPVMTWITEQWTGSSDLDADLQRGMTTTLARIKAAAEA